MSNQWLLASNTLYGIADGLWLMWQPHQMESSTGNKLATARLYTLPLDGPRGMHNVYAVNSVMPSGA